MFSSLGNIISFLGISFLGKFKCRGKLRSTVNRQQGCPQVNLRITQTRIPMICIYPSDLPQVTWQGSAQVDTRSRSDSDSQNQIPTSVWLQNHQLIHSDLASVSLLPIVHSINSGTFPPPCTATDHHSYAALLCCCPLPLCCCPFPLRHCPLVLNFHSHAIAFPAYPLPILTCISHML